ncbi:Phosphoribosylglycinamide formyltransferase [compost metagenome]
MRSDDTPESLAQRVHRGEHVILPRAVQWYGAGRLRLEDGSVMLDGRALSGPVIVESDA